MYFIPHLLKKDLIRHKVLLLLWLLLILAQSYFGIDFSFLQGLIIIVIAPLYIHEDSLVGSTAFWLTRPISRKGLLITKSLFIFSVFIALPVMAELFVLSANGVIRHHLLLAVPEILLRKFAFITPFLLLAAVTSTFSQYARVCIIIFVGFAAFLIISSLITTHYNYLTKYFYNPELYKNSTLSLSVDVAKNIFIILTGSVLIAHQFLTRRTSRTIIFFVVAYFVMSSFTRIWRWDFLKNTSMSDSTGAIPESLSFDFDRHQGICYSGDAVRTYDQTLMVKNLPMKQFAILKELENVRMKYPDRKVIKSECALTITDGWYITKKFTIPMQTALKDIKILNPYEEGYSSIEIFCIGKTKVPQGIKPGTYLASGTFDIYEYQVGLRMPLKQGTNDWSGSEQTTLYDIREKPNGVLVIIGEKKIKLLFDTSSEKKSLYDLEYGFSEFNHVYLIVNKERSEAFLPATGDATSDRREAESGRWSAVGSTHVTTKVTKYNFSHKNDRNWPLPKIDNEWIKGAELVRLDAVKIGTIHTDIKIEDFSI